MTIEIKRTEIRHKIIVELVPDGSDLQYHARTYCPTIISVTFESFDGSGWGRGYVDVRGSQRLKSGALGKDTVDLWWVKYDHKDWLMPYLVAAQVERDRLDAAMAIR